MIHKLKFILPILALALLGPACNEFLDVNDNPNAATEAPINGLLASGSYQTGINHYRVADITSYFTQYLASPNQGSTTDTYDEADYSGTWGNLYTVMTDLYDLINYAEEQGGRHHAGIGRILMAMNLGLAADMWGSVPYGDAFTGETIRPNYDPAPEVYNALFSLLDQGITDLQATDNALEVDGPSDFMHGGDIEAWIRTAHALKARYLNHYSKQGGYDPAAVLAEASQSYTSNADDAQITVFQNRNPWGQAAVNNENLLLDGWLSEQFIDALNGETYGTFDPRLPLITDTIPGGTYVGTPNGAGRQGDGTIQVECYLTTSGFYSMAESPLLVLTYAEVKFIEAEAHLRNGSPGEALTAFLEGIRANMDKVGVAESDREDYIASAYPGLSASTLTLDDIFREKYAALFLQAETWVDARRYDYDYKDFELPEGANLPTFIRRVQYPSTELTRNAENTPIVGSLDEHLFWDE